MVTEVFILHSADGVRVRFVKVNEDSAGDRWLHGPVIPMTQTELYHVKFQSAVETQTNTYLHLPSINSRNTTSESIHNDVHVNTTDMNSHSLDTENN